MASRIVLPATQLMYGDSFAGQALPTAADGSKNPETTAMLSNAAA
jgi:hypothetical protein